MDVDHDWGSVEDRRTPTGINIAVGAVLVAGVALLAAALFPPSELPGRLLVMALAVGGYAAAVADLKALAAVTLLAAATFIGFLVNQFGELTGVSGGDWAYTALIAFAAVLGVGYRHMRRPAPEPEWSPTPAPGAAPRPLPTAAKPVVAPPDDASGLRRAA